MHPFVALDFETANENRGSACAVALVKFDDNGQVEDHFETLLHPHHSMDYFSPINTWVHGIVAEDVEDAPDWEEIHEEVVRFIGESPIVAHNMAFDGYVLTDLDAIYGKKSLHNRRYCTARIARKLFPEWDHRGLERVFAHYYPGESFHHHSAGDDAWACGKVFLRMQEEQGMTQLDELCPPTGPAYPRRPRHRHTPAMPKASLEELLQRFEGTDSLIGQRVVFTGTMEIAQRATLHEMVLSLGGEIDKSTTRKTTILVMGIPNPASWAEGASGSRKLNKATQLRDAGSPITVMSEQDFVHFLHDGQP